MSDIRQFPSPAPDFAAARILGMPMQVGDAHITAVVRCLCLDGNVPMLIRGVDAGAICQNCGRVYGIARAIYDRQAHPGVPPQVEVGCLGFARQTSPLIEGA